MDVMSCRCHLQWKHGQNFTSLLCPQLQCFHRPLETVQLLLHVSSTPPQLHPVGETWISRKLHVHLFRWQVGSCKTCLSDEKIYILDCGGSFLPFTQVSDKNQNLKLAVINSISITVSEFSDLVWHRFLKFELELQLSISHLLFHEDWIDKMSDLQLFL